MPCGVMQAGLTEGALCGRNCKTERFRDQDGCCGSNVMTYVFVMSNEGNCAEALMMHLELRYLNPSNRDG